MKAKIQVFSTILLVVLYSCFFLHPNADLNYITVTYSQNQSASFQAEVKALDDMPTRKVKVDDIDIAISILEMLVIIQLSS